MAGSSTTALLARVVAEACVGRGVEPPLGIAGVGMAGQWGVSTSKGLRGLVVVAADASGGMECPLGMGGVGWETVQQEGKSLEGMSPLTMSGVSTQGLDGAPGRSGKAVAANAAIEQAATKYSSWQC
jgi:hypothetical protein